MTKFDDFVKEVEQEAQLEGPRAVAELEAFRAHYALAQDIHALRLRSLSWVKEYDTRDQVALVSGRYSSKPAPRQQK